MKGGILVKVFTVLGIVLFAAMFPTIYAAIGGLRYGYGALTNYIAFDTILSIAPTLLWLAGIGAFSVSEVITYRNLAAKDARGFMMMIMGVLEIVLFTTMFGTVLSNIATLYTGATNATGLTFVAYSTVISIAPTLLFLGGIGSGLFSTAAGGRKAWRSRGGTAQGAI